MHLRSETVSNCRPAAAGQKSLPQQRVALIAGLLALLCAPLASQEPPPDVPEAWRGNTGLVVSVVNDDGAPLPDVRVAVRLGETPEWLTTTTEADGRARFEGLAEGEWEVDVRREGFMLFTAFVALESGRKPKVAFSSRQRTGTYWEPLQAVFLPADVELTRGMASGRQSVDQALAEQRQRERREEAQERRAQRAAQRGELARVEDAGPERELVIRDLVEPTVDPAPERAAVGSSEAAHEQPVEASVAESSIAEPAPSAEAASISRTETRASDAGTEATTEGAATSTERGTAVARSDEGSAERPVPASTTAATTTAPTTEPLGVERPSIASATPQPAEAVSSTTRPARFEPRDPPRRLLANPNLRPAGACPECAPGEFSVASRAQAERWERGEACSTAPIDGLEELAVDLVGALDQERREFAGSLRESNGNDLLRLLPDELRDDVVGVAQSSADSCSLVGVVLPAGARYVGFRYQVGERSVMAECPDIQPDGSQVCQLADARWLGPPRIVKEDDVQFVFAMFENRSRRSTRLPQLVVYFEPARGWLPPSE